MKIKVGRWRIDIRSLFRVRWFPYPKIYLHEKFQKSAKWISRGITALGIGTCFLALPTLIDFAAAIVLLGIEVVVEKIVFEYSVVIIQSPPEFMVDQSQWITNGYLFPNPAYKQEYDLQNHFGPVYGDEQYGKAFFDYLKSWNNSSNDDSENNICLSFVIEPDNSYTTYLYANPNRKWLDSMFNTFREEVKYEKYGKVQQSLVMQMVYWKTLPNKKGTLFYSFVETQPKNAKYHFCPFYMDKGNPVAIESHVIEKYHYTVKYRQDVGKGDLEFYYGSTIKIDVKSKLGIPSNPQEAINKLFQEDFVASMKVAESVEFTVAENYEKSPPVICVLFSSSEEAQSAYGKVLERFTNTGSTSTFRQEKSGIGMTLTEHARFSIESGPMKYSEGEYKTFVGSEQSKGKIVLVFGFKDADQTIFVSTQENFSPLVLNKSHFR